VTTAAPLPRRLYGPVVSASTWKTTLKLYFDVPWMVVAAMTVMGPALGGAATIIVLPAAVVLGSIALVANRLAARVDRAALAEFLDVDVVPAYRSSPPNPEGRKPWSPVRLWRLFVTHVTDPAAWRSVGYRLVSLPITAISAVVVTLAWCVPFTFLLAPAWVTILPDQRLGSVPRPLIAGVTFLAGAALLPLAPWLVALAGDVMRRAARLLGARSDEVLTERIEQVESSRARVVGAAEAERRRIERDLHDGAQQRLVALAMNLGMARERYDRDPEGTRALLDEAHAEAKRAMVELRDLARGLHPAVLTDRGLGPALSAVAARSPVPVTVDVSVSGRLDEATEGIAYFIACEALANVAKHSRASAAHVAIGRRGDRLVIEVTDDGVGGADVTGSGLQGLRDRVEGVDGWFHIASPPGGPTTLLAELPCAS
jgi:signal transduction histidine kinase